MFFWKFLGVFSADFRF